MSKLAEIRAKIEAEQNKGQRTQSNQDSAIYPFWNIDEGATATVRFLPDGNTTNSFFWVERAVIKLPFNGIKGDSNVKQITVQVPCMETYGENCPILAEVRPWYKDDSMKEIANKYWKKRTYLYQGFVRQNPLGDDVTPVNPIRRFVITSQIQTIIKASLMDPEIDEMPTDYRRGLDFNIRKTPGKSGYSEYTTSSWSRKESALTEVEQAAIEAHGLYNLTDFLPRKPSETELRIIKEMFDASVDGRAYDNDKWGAYYRPYGLEAPAGTETSTSEAMTSTAKSSVNVAEDDEPPFDVDPIVVPKTSASADKTSDILAMIRARQQTK